MLNKVLPKSLIGQISLVMLLGVLLILSVTLRFFNDERQRALNFVSSDRTFEQVGSLINILDKTPIEMHRDIIRASQSRGFRLSLSNRAVVKGSGSLVLQQKLKVLLSDSAVQDIRIVAADIKFKDKNKDAKYNSSKRDERKKFDGIKTKLTGSVLLADDYWLNFRSGINTQASKVAVNTLMWVVLYTLVILVVMAWVIKRALKPIETLAVVAKKVGSERDFSTITEVGPSEILPAISAFNQMQANLSTFIDDRSKMLAAISHDLRTPITSLRLRLEFIEPGEDQRRMLETVHQMEKMLKATLDFAKDDAHKEAKQELEVVSLLTTICDDYRDRDIDIQLTSVDKLIFRLWPVAFRRVIENVINNSIAYGKNEAGEVHVAINVSLVDENLLIEISDSGKGVDESLFAEVVKPFVRLDKARDTQDSSVGLGLAISHGIVQAHAGEMTFSNVESGGFKVQIRLPKT